MSAVTRPRGPLPARVYWTRRTLVVLVALLLVFAVGRLLGGSGAGGNDPSARPVGAEASRSPTSTASPTDSPGALPTRSPTAPSTAPTVSASPSLKAKPGAQGKGKKHARAEATPLPASTGDCPTDEVVATPTIQGHAYAGKPVVFAMQLTTRSTAACDFDVSAHSLVVKVTSGKDRIWSTQDCHGAVPKESVVVRKDTPVTVDVAWNGQRSDSDCSRSTLWSEPGYYHAVAAAFGADPVDEQFHLLKPVRERVIETPEPEPKKAHRSGRR